jgi:hypothetical protein
VWVWGIEHVSLKIRRHKRCAEKSANLHAGTKNPKKTPFLTDEQPSQPPPQKRGKPQNAVKIPQKPERVYYTKRM